MPTADWHLDHDNQPDLGEATPKAEEEAAGGADPLPATPRQWPPLPRSTVPRNSEAQRCRLLATGVHDLGLPPPIWGSKLSVSVLVVDM